MRCLFGILFLLITPGVALAAGGSGGPPDWSLLLLPAVNFALYVWLMVFLYRKYGKPLLASRSVQLEQRLGKARNELRAAEEEYRQVAEQLKSVGADKAEMVEQYRAEGEKMKRTIVENARVQAQRIENDTERQIQSEISRAKKELRADTVARAAQVARERLSSNLSAEEDRSLREKILSEAMV